MSSPVSNGKATISIPTSDLTDGKYRVEINYKGNSYYNDSSIDTILELTSTRKVGCGTDTPWESSMMRGGIIDKDKVWVNYTCNPMILNTIAFTGDFKVTIEIGADYIGSYGTFGFSTSPTSVNSELAVNQNNLNGTSINNVFTVKDKVETITITRKGNTYTYTQNGESTSINVENTGTVYFYVQKSGNGSIFIETLKYTGGN